MNINENIIRRASNLLNYLTLEEAIAHLVEDGMDEGIAFLAVQAGLRMNLWD